MKPQSLIIISVLIDHERISNFDIADDHAELLMILIDTAEHVLQIETARTRTFVKYSPSLTVPCRVKLIICIELHERL